MGPPTSDRGAPLLIERIVVARARVEATVRVAVDAPMRTSEVSGVADGALGLLPGLRRHRCECGSAHGIAAELADTEIAHLLEHVALELMALSGSPRTLGGETRWDFAVDGERAFRVSLEYDDDIVALGALREGAGLVGALLGGTACAADVERAVGGLVRARGSHAR